MQTESPSSSISRTPKAKNSVSPSFFTRFLTHSGKSNSLEIQCNRNTKKLCYQLWARQSCERPGKRKWSLNACGRKQCLQVPGAPVQFLAPLPQPLSALQVISWGKQLHMPELQPHTGHSPRAAQAWPQHRGTTAHSREPAGCWQSLHGITWVMPDIPKIYWYCYGFKIVYL